MDVVRSELVDIVRDYLDVVERTRALFERFRAASLPFDDVRELFADDERSPLFRLKERSHDLFRRGADGAPMRRAALFDLAVGSLFHEAMKFRENFYQRVVYAPKVSALRDAAGAGDVEDAELFREFDKIQSASQERMEEALQETEALLVHTSEQLWYLLCGQDDGLITRYLIEQRERVERLYSAGLDSLLAAMHGDVADAHRAAALSYLESAHFGHALDALELALGRSGSPTGGANLERLSSYARGMCSFLAADYTASLDHLEAWILAEPGPDEAGYASLAHSAISRIDHLVQDEAVIARAVALAARIEPLMAHASPASDQPPVADQPEG